MATTAFDAKSKVVELLAAERALAEVPITYGIDLRDIQREWVAVGKIEWSDDDWAAIGARSRDESYEIALYVNVQKPGGTQREAEARVIEILTTIESALRANPTLDGLVRVAGFVHRNALAYPYVDGQEAQAEAVIRVKARI